MEESLIYFTIAEYIKAVVRIYRGSDVIVDLLALKKKLGEFQGKINSFKLNYKVIKSALSQMIKHIENFFLDREEML